VSAEEERRALGGRLDPAEQIADRRADLRTGVVLVDRESKPAKVLEHSIGDRTFLTGGTRHACELDEERGNFRQPVLHGPILEFP
jgi:hypothetical protein